MMLIPFLLNEVKGKMNQTAFREFDPDFVL